MRLRRRPGWTTWLLSLLGVVWLSGGVGCDGNLYRELEPLDGASPRDGTVPETTPEDVPDGSAPADAPEANDGGDYPTEIRCQSDTECASEDGWYFTQSDYACCDGDQVCSCDDQERRAHFCEGETCHYEIVETRTKTSECSSCDDGDSCTTNTCVDGSCSHPGICPGSDSACGCTSCTDCDSQDCWYDAGGEHSCCDGDQRCTCQDREYRDYECDGTSCTYTVTDETTKRVDCSQCPDEGWVESGSATPCCDRNNTACNYCQQEKYRGGTCADGNCTHEVTGTRVETNDCRECRTDGGELCGCNAGTCKRPCR